MNCHRFTNAGRITNYEIADLRAKPPRRHRYPWNLVWACLSDRFHPTSYHDWITNNPE
jgi:hypothetical protein